MIEISSYRQAYQFHQLNRLPFAILQDIAFMLMSAWQPLNPNLADKPSEINNAQLAWLSVQESAEFSFNQYLGGDVCICESESDLTSIKAFDPDWANEYGEWPDVTYQSMVWDVCHKLDEEWAVFCCIWNNAGGNTYYVPSTLWQHARLDEHSERN
jgi:hypothetical protein